ncbi:MAG: ATP-grasp domain-containing protein [Candidatus Lokiarchaeota archaeon]|nr:ATP-grasp domain-containing protein [Candidatus Lokiarchaeota archaeon]
MNIGILSKRTTMLTGKMKRYYEDKGFNVVIYTMENLIINETLFRNDFYILKSKSLFFLYAGFFLEANDIPVVPNPHSTFMQKNRIHSHFLIEKAGLLTPKFYCGTSGTLIDQLKPDIFPLILKPVVGSGSRGVKIINSIQELKSEGNKILYLENFIKGIHYNVYFIDDHICTLIKPPLSNEHLDMEKVKTPKDIEQLIKKWRTLLADNNLFGHLDIVRDESTKDLYIVDPGSFPEFTNWKCSGSPVEEICNLILHQVEKLKDKIKN